MARQRNAVHSSECIGRSRQRPREATSTIAIASAIINWHSYCNISNDLKLLLQYHCMPIVKKSPSLKLECLFLLKHISVVPWCGTATQHRISNEGIELVMSSKWVFWHVNMSFDMPNWCNLWHMNNYDMLVNYILFILSPQICWRNGVAVAHSVA